MPHDAWLSPEPLNVYTKFGILAFREPNLAQFNSKSGQVGLERLQLCLTALAVWFKPRTLPREASDPLCRSWGLKLYWERHLWAAD